MHAGTSATTPRLAFATLAVLVMAPGIASASDAKSIDFSKDAIKPTTAQTAAIQHAAARDIAMFVRSDPHAYTVAEADLNDDGRADLLVQYTDMAFCGSAGCSGFILMATPQGYAGKRIAPLPNFYGKIDILPTKHHGMHDLRYGGYTYLWKWNGKAYD